MSNTNEPTMRELWDITPEDDMEDTANMTRAEHEQHRAEQTAKSQAAIDRHRRWQAEYRRQAETGTKSGSAAAIAAFKALEEVDAGSGELTDSQIQQMFPSDDPEHIRAMLGKMK